MLRNIDAVRANLVLDSLMFLPELLLCFTVVLLLILRLFRGFDRWHLGGIALTFTLGALGVSCCQWLGVQGLERLLGRVLSQETAQVVAQFLAQGLVSPSELHEKGQTFFGGMLVYDNFTVYLRGFLFAFTALIIWLSLLTGIPDREDSGDFYSLLLGAAVGMSLMASANHLLMVYIGVEMASLPSYALAGFLKGRRQSSEAALKYVVYGGGSSGVMLYGISLLAGKFGTAYLPDLAVGFVHALYPPGAGGMVFDPVLVLGTLFIMVGVAFKLAAVPFHFWCPDVFEGASAEVAAFLSVASKGAALALLARITLVLAGLDPQVGTRAGVDWMSIVRYLVPALGFFAALTATFGNLAAYVQHNLKRLLAYSTIAHAGYMMMGLAALTRTGAEAVLFYLIAYLFMNLGAFAVVAFLRNQTGSEDLDSYRGLVRRSPWMVVTLCFFLLSLLGIPPLVGFTAKFQVFSTLFDEGRRYYQSGEHGLGATLLGLLVIGGLNSVLSAVYYVKVMKVMILDRRPEDLEGREPRPLLEPWPAVLYSALVTLAVVALGILWGPLDAASRAGVDRFGRAEIAPPAKAATPKGKQP
jgi:NADH-quinone oxidoreductase subunit N